MAGLELEACDNALAPFPIWYAEHRYVRRCRMGAQYLFGLARIHPCAPANQPEGSDVMVRFQHLASALADDNAGRHGITGHDARHDRSVGDPQLIDAVNPETVIHG